MVHDLTSIPLRFETRHAAINLIAAPPADTAALEALNGFTVAEAIDALTAHDEWIRNHPATYSGPPEDCPF
jgi:hypothetical protein